MPYDDEAVRYAVTPKGVRALAGVETEYLLAEPYRSAARNALIAKGTALALDGGYMGGKTGWFVAAKVNGHRTVFYEKTLTDCLIALAEAMDNTTQENYDG
jgi:hypothetical protein